MTRPRLMMFLLLSFAAVMAAGRFLFELGVALVGGNVHSALVDAPVTWLLLGLGALWFVAVGFAVRLWPPRWQGRQARTPAVDDEPPRPRDRFVNKLLRGVNSALVLAAAASLIGCSSCATLKEQGRAAAHDLIDCTTSQAEQLDLQFGPIMDKLLEYSTQNDGGIDWQSVKDTTRQLALDSGKCVLARAIARMLNPPARDPDAPQSEGLEVDRGRLMSAWRQLADGKVYRTPDGDI